MRQLSSLLTIILALLPAMQAPLQARDEVQAWQWLSLNLWKSGPHGVSSYMEHRLVDNASTSGLWLAGLYYTYAAKYLQTGVGFAYLDVKNLATDSWTYQLRPQLEINPHFKISDSLSFHFRNRLEVRYIESQSGPNVRTRHRFQLTRALDWKTVPSAYFNTELFYSHETHEFNEVRTVPLGLRLKLNDQTGLNLFYLIQSRRQGSASDWKHGHNLGTHLVYTF